MITRSAPCGMKPGCYRGEMTLFHFQSRHPVTDDPIEVEAEYWPARRGSRDSDGLLLEPDEPAEVVIRKVWDHDGVVPHQSCEEALILEGLKVAAARRKNS